MMTLHNFNIHGWLDELAQKFEQAIKSQFQIINQEVERVEIELPTKYGYKIGHESVKYKIEPYIHSEPLKWGFEEDKIEYVNENESGFDPEYVLPDREAMDLIVQKSHKEFEAYVHATLAKMTLLGHTMLFYPLHRDPNDKYQFNYTWSLDDSCVSDKGNCVTHILLHPMFRVASEESRSGVT